MSCKLECIGWGNTTSDGVNLEQQSASCKDFLKKKQYTDIKQSHQPQFSVFSLKYVKLLLRPGCSQLIRIY